MLVDLLPVSGSALSSCIFNFCVFLLLVAYQHVRHVLRCSLGTGQVVL